MEKVISRHVFSFNEDDNDGEQLLLTTEFIDNGDPKPFTTQELELQSYCNSAGFNLVGIQLTPAKLRELANELEKELIKAEMQLAK